MLINALSQARARRLEAGKYADGRGLWLVKRNSEAGKWVLRLVIHGRRREMGLGRWPDVSLIEARHKADEARRTCRDGKDPIFERIKLRRTLSPLSLKEVIEDCFESRKAELKNDGKAGRWMSPLSVHIIPKIGSYPIIEVDQHVLRNVLGPIWHSKPEAAEKALNRINLALKHAAALGLSVDMQATMKAKALLGKQRRERTHIASMPYPQLPEFYRWLKTQSSVSAIALRLLILTVGRTSEIRLAEFDEFDGDLWNLSGARTKNGIARRIPLTLEALQLVQSRREQRGGNFLFPAYMTKPISDAAMSAFMKREGYEARPHGFRASFRTWVEEQTDAPFEVKESCLGHVVDTGVVGAYQRSDRLEKRRKLLDQWEKFLMSAETSTK